MAYLVEFEFLGSLGVYPIICCIVSAAASAFCFYFFYLDRATLADVSEVGLLGAVLSVQFKVAVYLSLATAVPMGVDLITEAINVPRHFNNALLHCFIRSCLLISLTLPSILLAIPSVFHGQEDSGYLAVDSVKRISATGCMLAFISCEFALKFRDINLQANSSGRRKRSIGRGRLTVTLYLTYVAAELLWLYGYRYQHSILITYCLKVAATTLLSLGYLQLLHLLYFCENFNLGQFCTSRCRSAFSKNISVSQNASCHNLLEDVATSGPNQIDLYDSKKNTCIRIYFAVLIIQPIGSYLISSSYGSMDFLSATPDSISANLYFQMVLTILVIVVPGRILGTSSCNVPPTSTIENHSLVRYLSIEVMKPMIDIQNNIALLKENISLLLDEIVYYGEDHTMNIAIDTVKVDPDPDYLLSLNHDSNMGGSMSTHDRKEDLAFVVEKMESSLIVSTKKVDATADAIAALSLEFSPIRTSGSTVISSEKIEGSEPLPAVLEVLTNEETVTTIDLIAEIKTLKSTTLVEKSLEIESTELSKRPQSNRRLSDIETSPLISEQQLLPHMQLINSIYLNRIVSQYLPDLESLCSKAISKLNDFVILDAIYCKNMQLNFQECHPGIFFHELCKKFEPKAADQHIALGIKSDLKFDNDFIFADPMKLCKAFENLITNAIENTPKHGIIQICLSRESMSTATRRGTLHNLKNWITRSNAVAHKGDSHDINYGNTLQKGEYLLVEVTDSGNGLSKILIDTIFNEYLPSAKNDISSMKSTANLFSNNPVLNTRGLGLPIAKGIMEYHKGTITCHSRGEGCGATFSCFLPLYSNDVQAPAVKEISLSTRVSNQREAPKQWINNPDLVLRKSDSKSECLLGWYIPDYNKMESNHELPQENSVQDRCDPVIESKKQHFGMSTKSSGSRPPSNRDISVLRNGSNGMMISSRVASNSAFYRDRDLLENSGASLSSSPIPRCTSGRISVMDIVRSRSRTSSIKLQHKQSSRLHDSSGLLCESAPHDIAPGAQSNYSPFSRSRKKLSDIDIQRNVGVDNGRTFNLNPNQSGKFQNREDALRQGSATKSTSRLA